MCVTACVAVQVMQGGAYVAALLRLCRHSSEAVIRRALKLITTSVAKLSLQEQPDIQVLCCLCWCPELRFSIIGNELGGLRVYCCLQLYSFEPVFVYFLPLAGTL